MNLLMEESFINYGELIAIVITTEKSVNYFMKGYHAYKYLWKPFMNEELTTTMEPDNVVHKYAVCVKKSDVLVGHLSHGENRRFAKTIFYFLGADKYAECKVIITGKDVNLGDGEGMQEPFLLKISRTKTMSQILILKF